MEAYLTQLVPLTLVAFRLSGLFVFAPILAGVAIPMQVRVLLCFVLALCMSGLVAPAAPTTVPGDAFSFAAAAAMETVIGAVIGLIALIPVIAAQMGGVIMGQQMGLSLATVYNPATDAESEVTSELLMYGALAVFVIFGGIEAMFTSVARSFGAVPLGVHGALSQAEGALEIATGAVGSGFELALRVSTPVVGIIFVETIASAMVMKTMPQMNIMSIGFGLKVILGLGALALALRSIDDATIEHITQGGRLLLNWPSAPAPAGGGV